MTSDENRKKERVKKEKTDIILDLKFREGLVSGAKKFRRQAKGMETTSIASSRLLFRSEL